MIALTHLPSTQMQAGVLTFIEPAQIDHARAAQQHAAYCEALRDLRMRVVKLDGNANEPDGVFIEDTAIVLDEVAVLCSLGTPARRKEPAAIEPILRQYRDVVRVEPPATIEGGDCLRVGRTLLVGWSCRTNAAGIAVLREIVLPLGYDVRSVPVTGCLHLKTACTALPDGRLLINPAWIDAAALADFECVSVPADEPWGANAAIVRSSVLLAAEHPKTAALIESLGFDVRLVELSEFAKAEGGVTCLGLFIS